GLDGRPFVEGMLGEATTSVDDLEPEAFRRGLHAAIAAALGRLADAGPALLVIEDIHWADPSSLALLGELTRTLAGRGLAFVLLSRREELARLAEAITIDETIELRPLGGEAVEQVMAEVLE